MRPADPEFASVPSGGGSLRDHMSSWTGDLENDVAYCRRILGRLGTDGKRITMWRRWLNVDEHQSKASGKSSSEDDEANPGIPSESGDRGEDLEESIPKEWAVAIIRCYVSPLSDMTMNAKYSIDPNYSPFLHISRIARALHPHASRQWFRL